MRKAMLIGLILAGIWIVADKRAQAQTPSALPPVICYQVAHTSCIVTAGVTTYAFASDGFWISLNGAAFAQVQPASTGFVVTSLNGKTGALTITANSTSPAVSVSVN